MLLYVAIAGSAKRHRKQGADSPVAASSSVFDKSVVLRAVASLPTPVGPKTSLLIAPAAAPDKPKALLFGVLALVPYVCLYAIRFHWELQLHIYFMVAS